MGTCFLSLSVTVIKEKQTASLSHPVPALQPILHDANELLVAEFIVAILVEDLEDGVDQVAGQLDVCSHVDSAGKLL